MRVGTPRYMSPEQAKADCPVGPAADVYALSTILYEPDMRLAEDDVDRTVAFF